MSSGTVEAVPVEDLEGPLEELLRGVPPCEALLMRFRKTVSCGRPSVTLVSLTCPCGNKKALFLCRSCLGKLHNRAECGDCGNRDFAWRDFAWPDGLRYEEGKP